MRRALPRETTVEDRGGDPFGAAMGERRREPRTCVEKPQCFICAERLVAVSVQSRTEQRHEPRSHNMCLAIGFRIVTCGRQLGSHQRKTTERSRRQLSELAQKYRERDVLQQRRLDAEHTSATRGAGRRSELARVCALFRETAALRRTRRRGR